MFIAFLSDASNPQVLTDWNDTTFVLEHPNSKDSAMVVSIIKHVATVVSVPLRQPLLIKFLNDEKVQIGIAGIILALWRRFEMKRIKKRYKKVDS